MSIEDDDKEAAGSLWQVPKIKRTAIVPAVQQNDPISPDHYSRFPIQPIDFIIKNKLSYLQGNIIKYVCRFDAKNGVEDLKKAKQYLEWLIEEAEKNDR